MARAHEELAARVVGTLKSKNLTASARVLPGDPRDVIVRVAQMERADMVVMGSHGRTGLSRLMMGSVASHVVAHAPCSVLVVRTPKESALRSGPALAGASTRPD
jgi:nucleotide-binding universal stress UspA family protein